MSRYRIEPCVNYVCNGCSIEMNVKIKNEEELAEPEDDSDEDA